jgi:hypothetical protein
MAPISALAQFFWELEHQDLVSTYFEGVQHESVKVLALSGHNGFADSRRRSC